MPSHGRGTIARQARRGSILRRIQLTVAISVVLALAVAGTPALAQGPRSSAADRQAHQGGNVSPGPAEAPSLRTAPSADLSLELADAPDPVTVGNDLVYTVTVHNAGPDPAASVVVEDLLPVEVSFVSASSGCANDGSGTVTCALGTVASSATVIKTITVHVDSVPDVGPIDDTGSVSSTTDDPDLSNNEGETTTTESSQADLSMAKSAAPDTVGIGGTITYTLQVHNAGPGSAEEVDVIDELPPQVSFSTASTGCQDDGTGFVTCDLGTVAGGATVSKSIS